MLQQDDDKEVDHELNDALKSYLAFPEKNQELLTYLFDNLKKNPSDLKELGEYATLAGAQLRAENVPFENTMLKKPVTVAITGAAGQIGYSLIPRIAAGMMLGKDQPIKLQLLELPQAMDSLDGVAMEVEDCAFPLVESVVCTSDANVAFKDADYVMLVGSKPRGPGMERVDVLKDNGKIFSSQGKALNHAKKTCKVVVVGNPANTNAMIASANCKTIPAKNFTSMMRLDQNRAIAQLAQKTKSQVSEIENVIVWGNHSASQVPDINHATIGDKTAVSMLKGDEAWIGSTFIPTVANRGAAIIKARKFSSAASAADAAIQHMRDWVLGSDGKWVSMGIPSTSDYGVGVGVWCSYPVVCKGDGQYEIVKGLKMSADNTKRFNASVKELKDEKTAVKKLL